MFCTSEISLFTRKIVQKIEENGENHGICSTSDNYITTPHVLSWFLDFSPSRGVARAVWVSGAPLSHHPPVPRTASLARSQARVLAQGQQPEAAGGRSRHRSPLTPALGSPAPPLAGSLLSNMKLKKKKEKRGPQVMFFLAALCAGGYELYNILHAEQRAGFVPWHLALHSRTSEVKHFIIILSLAAWCNSQPTGSCQSGVTQGAARNGKRAGLRLLNRPWGKSPSCFKYWISLPCVFWIIKTRSSDVNIGLGIWKRAVCNTLHRPILGTFYLRIKSFPKH